MKHGFCLFLIFLLVALSALSIRAQRPRLSTVDKKAEKIFYEALDSYQSGNLEKASGEIQRAVKLDPDFTEAYILSGDIQAEMHRPESAIDAYQKAVSISNSSIPGLFYMLANLQISIGRYTDARKNYERYIELTPANDPKRNNSLKGLGSSKFGEESISNPVPFIPENLGDSVNTPYDEFINGITADGEWLYFTRWDPVNGGKGENAERYNEDFYVCGRRDSSWTKYKNLGAPINTIGNEGAMSVSPDGSSLFFAACNRDDSFGSCDIYYSRRIGQKWSEPQNLGEIVNSGQWDSQPSFSSDGRTLYFASKRPGGKGNSDIWKTERRSDGSWTRPVNLGDSVNTAADEMAPFIHPDDHTLYFSSRGHTGMGGFDLYLARKKNEGTWSRPVNLGYPINTWSDEITVVVNASGDLAYISTDKLGGKGRQDIYQFPLYEKARPELTTYFKGIVYDEDSKKRLEAHFELTDLTSQKIVAESKSDPVTGEFLLVLPTDRNYGLNVSLKDYLFYSENFMLTGTGSQAKPFIKNIPMKPIRIGEAVILKNIFFDTDKYNLREESQSELENLTELLKRNPEMKIEISGHTDNVGSALHNRELSANRAKAVFEYLKKNGVDPTRLSYAGFGFDRPIDTNETETGRANNRRTEFKVVGN